MSVISEVLGSWSSIISVFYKPLYACFPCTWWTQSHQLCKHSSYSSSDRNKNTLLLTCQLSHGINIYFRWRTGLSLDIWIYKLVCTDYCCCFCWVITKSFTCCLWFGIEMKCGAFKIRDTFEKEKLQNLITSTWIYTVSLSLPIALVNQQLFSPGCT